MKEGVREAGGVGREGDVVDAACEEGGLDLGAVVVGAEGVGGVAEEEVEGDAVALADGRRGLEEEA